MNVTIHLPYEAQVAVALKVIKDGIEAIELVGGPTDVETWDSLHQVLEYFMTPDEFDRWLQRPLFDNDWIERSGLVDDLDNDKVFDDLLEAIRQKYDHGTDGKLNAKDD